MHRKLIISCLVGCLSIGSVYTFADTLSEEKVVQVEGVIHPYQEPVMINLTLPSKLTFNINPNDEAGNYFTASEFLIDNLSDVPLAVSVKNFQSSQAEGVYQFQDVLPAAHENWLALSEEETMRDLALGLKVVNPDQWTGAVRTETLWVRQVQDANADVFIGSIPAQTEGIALTLEAKHGLKFSKWINPTYDITLLFEYKQTS